MNNLGGGPRVQDLKITGIWARRLRIPFSELLRPTKSTDSGRAAFCVYGIPKDEISRLSSQLQGE
jgi:hypothetical protein